MYFIYNIKLLCYNNNIKILYNKFIIQSILYINNNK